MIGRILFCSINSAEPLLCEVKKLSRNAAAMFNSLENIKTNKKRVI